MWLPKDERYLLMAYYICLPRPSAGERIFSIDELQCFFIKKYLRIPLVGPKIVARLARLLRDQKEEPTSTHNKSQNHMKEMLEWLEAKQRIESTNTMLKERGLVEARECGTGFYEIEMKLKGLDLGRKYTSWFIPSGLWFEEYRNHWLWLIVGFLGGIIGALIVNWLSNGGKCN